MGSIGYFFMQWAFPTPFIPKIQSVEDIVALFPATKECINERIQQNIAQAESALKDIYAIDANERTFANTIAAYDKVVTRFRIMQSVLETLTLVSPEEAIRTAAHKGHIVLQAFSINNFLLNPEIYKAVMHYKKRLEDKQFKAREALDKMQQYALDELIRDFEQAGLALPAATQEKLRELHKKLSEHELAFDAVLSDDQRAHEFSREQLKGWDDACLPLLKKTSKEMYVVGTDSATYAKMFSDCTSSSTRKTYYRLYMQRGYPENAKHLKALIAIRDEIAHLLGYASYAAFDIASLMAKNIENVETFIADVEARAKIKIKREMTLIEKDLPPGVHLAPSGKFYPWDMIYVLNYYKKKYLAIDEAEIAEYFPVEYALPAMLTLYEHFFNIHFKKIDEHVWHEDTLLYAVYQKGNYRGALILDLYPRPHKYTKAATVGVVPAIKTKRGDYYPAVVVVIANFPRSLPGMPVLLKRNDMTTFFHECGHAMHHLLGDPEIGIFAGTNVKADFVEMPGILFEQWMWEPSVLKMVSRHYKTHKPLSDELIQKIQTLKNFDSGEDTLRQLAFAQASLEYFLPGAKKDCQKIWESIYERFRINVQFDPLNRGYCSFIHLTNYAAHYYGYLLSKVYALDLFDYIKKYGLTNPLIGERFNKEVLSKGGAEDPMQILTHFLGRKPNSDAFFKDLGLNVFK